jgi:hypothetical protein
VKVAVWLGALTWAAAGTAHAQAGLDGVAIHRVDPRPLAALVVYYVGDVGSGGDADLTLILQRFGRVLEAETGMTLARGYEATGAECVRAVGQVEVCMLGRLLSGLDPTAPAFAERTPAEVADALRAKSELPQILLLLGVRKDGAQGRWRLKALPVPHMLELAAGLQHPRRARGEPLLDAPRLQDELDLAGASVVTSTVVTDLGSEVAFARLLRGPLAPLFVEHPPRATVEVSGVPEGGAVQLAGDRVYAAGPAGLRLEDVRPGEYHLRVDAAGYAPYAADLRLGAGERRQVQVDLRSRAGQVGRLGVRWGGGGPGGGGGRG